MPLQIKPGLTYYTRAQWGADTSIPRLGWSVNRLDRTEAIMHHTVIIDDDATPNVWETLAEVFAKMRQLQRIRPDLGLDVPYNFVAFHMADGSLVICEGRGFDRTGAHTYGHNTRGLATAGEGNFSLGSGLNPSPYADHWSRWWGYCKFDMGMENLGSSHPTGRIAYGHKDLASTSCPGAKLYAIIPQLTFKEENMGLTAAQVRALKYKMGRAYNTVGFLLDYLWTKHAENRRAIAENRRATVALRARVKVLEDSGSGNYTDADARAAVKERL